MAEGENSNKSFTSNDLRYKYIGFGVFPGKAGSIFSSDEERKSIIEKVRAKLARSQGEVRDGCTLMEGRVSNLEKVFLTLASVALIVSLFIPWFSGYVPVDYEEVTKEGSYLFVYSSHTDEASILALTRHYRSEHDQAIPRTVEIDEQAAVEPPAGNPAEESAPVEGEAAVDEAAVAESGEATEAEPGIEETPVAAAEPETEAAATTRVIPVPAEIKVVFVDAVSPKVITGNDPMLDHAIAQYTYNRETGTESFTFGHAGVMRAVPDLAAQYEAHKTLADSLAAAGEEAVAADDAAADSTAALAGLQPRREQQTVRGVVNDYYSLTGLGAVAAIGTFGSMVFSSGIILKLTGVLLIVYLLCCVLLGLFNLYNLYGVKKKSPEEYVLHLKRVLKLNWIPVLIWLGIFILSFVGASYSFTFDPKLMVSAVGKSYGAGSFIGLVSFGMFMSMAGFLIMALKGKEI